MKLSVRLVLLCIVAMTCGQQITNITESVLTSEANITLGCGILKLGSEIGNSQQIWPVYWTAKFIYPPSSSGLTYEGLGCIGNLIRPNVLLSAAQCVAIIRPSQVSLPLCGSDGMSCFKEVTQIILHPNYSQLDPNQVNDVALIKLDSDVGDIGTLCISSSGTPPPPINKLFEYVNAGDSYILVAGNKHQKGSPILRPGGKYGISPIFEMAPTGLVSQEECLRLYNNSIRLGDSQLCGKGQGPAPAEPCVGDTGAPLVTLVDNSRWTMIAMVTLGLPKCADDDKPTIYTNVGSHIEWIEKTLTTL